MSFNIALSGINASQKDLDTTANNISNVKTTGFKQSRAEFADIYASSIFNSGRAKVGDGVLTASVAQQFSQGTLEFTENSLDLAISGNGFFATASQIGDQDYNFTRSGAFKLNNESYMVDNNGNYLMGFPVDEATGANQSTSLATAQPIRIPDTAGAPNLTENVNLSFNLDSRSQEVAVETGAPTDPDYIEGRPFNPEDRNSYTSSTSTTIYDSLGESHVMTTYYVRREAGQGGENGADAVPDDGNSYWDVYSTVDGLGVDLQQLDTDGLPIPGAEAEPTAGFGDNNASFSGIRVAFGADGLPSPDSPGYDNTLGTFSPASAQVGSTYTNGANGAQRINIDFNDPQGDVIPTQYASEFEVNFLEQDGSTVGRLTQVDTAEDGKISATYSNGDTRFLGQVALVRFANEQGLTQVGGTSWKQSSASGEALAGEANSGTFGAIESSALENSNVNLTKELVDLISAQRNFQANSRSLEVNNTINQAILQIR
ncbi:flagellar hook protein FlgE [Idiomarina fontislapidosi]|uniref:Flagellar hook protein FlgE n=1 Tax=Idiomarina fontislapidosi TaxID=263723 RepID=A0A432XYR7_9GAMM|nr:flagellar hook protein FlgE [Idiomarina fontislapidosi]PYE32776.1 flagellar hook protein FlgE [Idiomarina fontislapidosi]RUO53783.1 flagellar hook protein FlgE [Idiomarina fontislapidosi]